MIQTLQTSKLFKIGTTLLAMILYNVTATAAPVTIQVASLWNLPAKQAQGYVDVVEAFSREHPDIEVDLVLGVGADKFRVALAGGVAPDVYSAGDSDMKTYILEGYASDITPYFRADPGIAPSDFLPPAWGRVEYRKQVWGLPFSAEPNFAMYVNGDHMGEAGMEAAAIKTIADLDRAHLRLTRVSGDGTLENIGITPWDIIGGYGNGMFTWGWVFGGSFYDAGTERITPAHLRNVAALEWILSHDERQSRAQIVAAMPGSGIDRFCRGQLTMFPGNPPQIGNIRSRQPSFDVEIVPMPYHQDQPAGNTMWLGGHTFFVSATSAQKEAAYRFIRYAAATPEGSRVLLSPSGFFPAYRRSNVYKEHLADPWGRTFVELQMTATLHRGDIPATQAYNKALTDAVTAVIQRKKLPRAALEDVERQVQPDVVAALSKMR